MSELFHRLKVSEVVAETDQASSIYFDIPADLKETFTYNAGQYITLKFELDGQEVRRAYSLCTSPLESRFGVNVKRVKKGLVSNHVNDHIKPGTEIDVMPPDGNFGLKHNHSLERDLYFIAAGSGITPIISIIKTIIEEEPKSRCHLLYGNKTEQSVIFKREIDDLATKYAGQLFVTETLSQPSRTKEGGLKGLFSRGKQSWTGWKGRLDGKKIDAYLEEQSPMAQEVHYFVCGPGAMIDTIVDHLEQKGVPSDRLHTEHFVSSTSPVAAVGAVSANVKVHLNGQSYDVQVPPEKTILDVLIDNKVDAPYSCTSGACSTCIAKLTKGTVSMDACYALDDDEVKEGYILVCQSRATSPEVELTFDT